MTEEQLALLEKEEVTQVFAGEENPAPELSEEEKDAILQKGKRIVESLLFCSSEPITFRRISNVLQTFHPMEKEDVKRVLEELAKEYEEQDRAFRLEEIARGYILRTCEEFSPYIHAMLKTSRPEKLSHAATEVLAIIAFRQPITRPQIDEIRGVDSSGIISTLVERELVEQAGKLEVPGRPTLFRVTNHFLKHFGMKDLRELPNLGSDLKVPLGPPQTASGKAEKEMEKDGELEEHVSEENLDNREEAD